MKSDHRQKVERPFLNKHVCSSRIQTEARWQNIDLIDLLFMAHFPPPHFFFTLADVHWPVSVSEAPPRPNKSRIHRFHTGHTELSSSPINHSSSSAFLSYVFEPMRHICCVKVGQRVFCHNSKGAACVCVVRGINHRPARHKGWSAQTDGEDQGLSGLQHVGKQN